MRHVAVSPCARHVCCSVAGVPVYCGQCSQGGTAQHQCPGTSPARPPPLRAPRTAHHLQLGRDSERVCTVTRVTSEPSSRGHPGQQRRMARSVARPGGADTQAVSPPPPTTRGRGLIQCVRFKARLAAAGGLRCRPKLHQICAERPSLGQAAPCVSALLLVCPTFHHNPDTGPDPRQTASPRGGLHGEVRKMISEGNLAQFSYDFCKTDGLFPYYMST